MLSHIVLLILIADFPKIQSDGSKFVIILSKSMLILWTVCLAIFLRLCYDVSFWLHSIETMDLINMIYIESVHLFFSSMFCFKHFLAMNMKKEDAYVQPNK